MLIRTLGYDLGELLTSSPGPDVYGTPGQILAGWRESKRSYDNQRNELKEVYEDAGAPFEPLGACLERTNANADCVTD